MGIFTILTATLLALTLASDPLCATGRQARAACCPWECGICGGPKCGERTRATRKLCCKGAILRAPPNCLTAPPPCKITTTDPNFKAGSDTPDPKCETGLLRRGACCPAECSRCGGEDCKARGRKIRSHCCVGSIKRRARRCDVVGPPCIVEDAAKSGVPEVTILPKISQDPESWSR